LTERQTENIFFLYKEGKILHSRATEWFSWCSRREKDNSNGSSYCFRFTNYKYQKIMPIFI